MIAGTIDINADLGEGGAVDDQLFRLISSANIACGSHAGDAASMRRSVKLAISHHVTIGAHPSLDDMAGFGRTWIPVSPENLHATLVHQITTLLHICNDEGTDMSYVKAHGALYNRAAIDSSVAETVCRAVSSINPALRIVTQPGSVLEREAMLLGLPVIREVFADRASRADGTLIPRDQPGAVFHDPEAIAARMVKLITTGELIAINGEIIHLSADTICIHSDTPGAVQIATVLGDHLHEAGIAIQAPS
ncbi:MAG: 5-oxoprolinase subunit PxpA [Thermomicrobiales bacterium]